MPRRRDLKLDKYGISKEAYRELRSFCLQYEEKKARLQQLRSIASAPITGMPGKNEPGNPTAKHAEMAVKLSNDIAMIEQSALEASGNLQRIYHSACDKRRRYIRKALSSLRPAAVL